MHFLFPSPFTHYLLISALSAVLCVRPIPPHTETYPNPIPISQKLRNTETSKL